MTKTPNPQGKGTPGVLATLSAHRHALSAVPAKPIDQMATELFTSLFVLEARFRFKPVPGTVYYLYLPTDDDAAQHDAGHFQLCLTPPSMMPEAVGGRFIAQCQLQADMTWTVALDGAVAEDLEFTTWLAEKRRLFDQHLSRAQSVDDVLPHYEKRLSFHRRAAAFAVAFSLRQSMSKAGLLGLGYDEALKQLGHDRAEPAA